MAQRRINVTNRHSRVSRINPISRGIFFRGSHSEGGGGIHPNYGKSTSECLSPILFYTVTYTYIIHIILLLPSSVATEAELVAGFRGEELAIYLQTPQTYNNIFWKPWVPEHRAQVTLESQGHLVLVWLERRTELKPQPHSLVFITLRIV